jgi:hypothetical protein
VALDPISGTTNAPQKNGRSGYAHADFSMQRARGRGGLDGFEKGLEFLVEPELMQG